MTHNLTGLTRCELFGIGLDPLTMSQAVSRCTNAVERGGYLSVGVVNAAKVVAIRKSDRLRQAVRGCDLVLAGGRSVVWASRMLGSPLPERVTGAGLFLQLLEQSAARGYRVYFLGGRAEALDQMLAQARRQYPGLTVAGARDGYFAPGAERDVAAQIRRARADLLFIAMSSPLKELFASQWGASTGAGVVHSVGGSFGILSGQTRKAPGWRPDRGPEWPHRAWPEPVRLGRRYLSANSSFLALVAGEMIRRGSIPAALAGGDPR